MEKMHIKPAEGLKIRDDKTKQFLPIEGKIVEKSTYWVRRLQCGDVVLVENAKRENAPAAKAPETKKAKAKEGDE